MKIPKGFLELISTVIDLGHLFTMTEILPLDKALSNCFYSAESTMPKLT